MAKKNSYSQSKRTQLQTQLKAEAERKQRNRLIGIICGVLVVALILVIIVVVQTRDNTPDDETTPVTTPVVSGTSDVMFTPPNGTSDMAWIQVASANIKPDAIVVDEHLDYQCPICRQVDIQFGFGAAFRQLAERGDIVLHVHIRSFMDNRLYNDSSTRAARAATCADTVGRFIDYHETIFTNQPAIEGTGYTDQQLRVDFPKEAGITGKDLTDFQACYDTRQTLAYVQGMEQVNFTSQTVNGATQSPPGGTPAFYVNGKPMSAADLVNKTNSADLNSVLDFLKSVAG